MSAGEASDAGQKSIEHLTGILIECSDKEAELRDKLVKADSPVAVRARVHATAIETYDEKKAAALFARFAKNQTWQCPTLTVLRNTKFLLENPWRDGRLKYISRQMQQRWNVRSANLSESAKAGAKRVLQKEFEIVGAMRKAGVPILAGTDTGNPFCYPGFSLHEELALLVIAGLTPVEALRSATLNPAEFFGLDKTLGTVEQGKIADLVLLDANPLQDIRNTQKISAVISNGRLFDRKALDKMLADAEGVANR